MEAPEPILTVAQVHAAEQALFDDGLPEYDLMVRAGEAAARWVWRATSGGPVTILCGPGNNGGDGYVMARWLRERGCQVSVVAPLEPSTPSARTARSQYPGDVQGWEGPVKGGALVDCLFGSGQNRPLSDELSGRVQAIRARHGRHIALDLPSGVDSDRGELLNALAPFDLTLALGAWKWAHWTQPAAAVMGQRVLVDIGLPLDRGTVSLSGRPRLGVPSANAHKYTRGLVAVIAGTMPGAACLAAMAAQHGGAGYVKIIGSGNQHDTPHSIVIDQDPVERALGDSRVACILAGPGLGRDSEAAARLDAVLTVQSAASMVLDADALHLIDPESKLPRHGRCILTPHEGELAALARSFDIAPGPSIREPEKVSVAKAVAEATGAVVVAKGADTVIASPGGEVRVARPASSWLATAGTGDVLAGLIASRLATGEPALAAAEQAVWLHGEAARLSGPAFSADGLVTRLSDAYSACL